jgi:serine/threonine protein kinase
VTDHPATAIELLAGRYRLERLLGQGGMADVYLAVDLGSAPASATADPEASALVGAARGSADPTPVGPAAAGPGAVGAGGAHFEGAAAAADGAAARSAQTGHRPTGPAPRRTAGDPPRLDSSASAGSGELVAVKLVRSSDPALARRMAQEARALGRLQHPALVALRDAGVSDGRAYLVMDLVDGPTLAQRLRSGPLTPAATADLAGTIAGALAYVHAHGIVHRDVKPGNVMLDAHERPRLADFGIASMADASNLTATGTTLGTAAYMAPEQLEHHLVGPPADIWSLAMILLECLLGRRIYEGTPVEVVARRLSGPIPLPPELPAPWRMLLAGMFDHDPARRPNAADVEAMVQANAFSTPWQPPALESDPSQSTAVLPDGPLVGAPAGAETLGGAAEAVPGAEALAGAEVLGGAEALAGAEAVAPTQALDPAAGHDLAALRDVDPTLFGLPPGGDLGSGASGGKRSRWVPWAAAAAAVALIIAVAALLGSSSGTHHPKVAPKRHTPSSTTTTTAPPSTASTATALLGLVSEDAAAGALSADQATAIGRDVSTALIDAATGHTSGAASDLDDAASQIAKAVAKGTMSSSQAAQLLGDLSTFATAAGLPTPTAPKTTTAPTTATTPTTTTPAPSGGPGLGNQKPGKGRGKP